MYINYKVYVPNYTTIEIMFLVKYKLPNIILVPALTCMYRCVLDLSDTHHDF